MTSPSELASEQSTAPVSVWSKGYREGWKKTYVRACARFVGIPETPIRRENSRRRNGWYKQIYVILDVSCRNPLYRRHQCAWSHWKIIPAGVYIVRQDFLDPKVMLRITTAWVNPNNLHPTIEPLKLNVPFARVHAIFDDILAARQVPAAEAVQWLRSHCADRVELEAYLSEINELALLGYLQEPIEELAANPGLSSGGEDDRE